MPLIPLGNKNYSIGRWGKEDEIDFCRIRQTRAARSNDDTLLEKEADKEVNAGVEKPRVQGVDTEIMHSKKTRKTQIIHPANPARVRDWLSNPSNLGKAAGNFKAVKTTPSSNSAKVPRLDLGRSMRI
jgi:hypothetical protein